MNDIYQYLIAAKTLVDGVSNNKVANFSYTQTAYTEDTVDGVAEYSYGNDQNIPLGSHTDLDQNVRDKGIRSQAASLPRNAINHFFGRVSYNLNKITDTLNSFIAHITRAFTQNGSFYAALAEYKQYDTCTMLVTEDGGKLLKTFLRTSSVPEVIQGVIPISGGVVNTEHWKLMYSTDTVTQLTADSSTKIASTELVDNKIAAYNSLVNASLATKAPINHASGNTTYGVATTSEYGHIKLANALANETTTVPTSAILFAVNNTLTNALAAKANLASPAFTGNPTAPTQAAGNNSTRIATTAFVTAALAAKANLASPAFTGNPTAPTQAARNNSTRLATTAFVTAALAAYVPTSRTLTAGSGLSGGGTLAENRSFAVDSTVVRTSGTQTIDGSKSFSSVAYFNSGVHMGGLLYPRTNPTFGNQTIAKGSSYTPERGWYNSYITNFSYNFRSGPFSGAISVINIENAARTWNYHRF